MQKLVVVMGATGRQGGAVARHVLAGGMPVRVVTRDPTKPAAQHWRAQGAEVMQADQESRASLDAALAGASAVYSLQNYWEKGVGYAGELRQGKLLADAAKAAGVATFLQASVAVDAGDEDGAPQHFRSKYAIEAYARGLGLDVISLAPAFFYDNFLDPKTGKMTFPLLAGTLRRDLKFHGVDVDDIGVIARRVLEAPAAYVGTRLNIAGDALTVTEMKETWARVLGFKPPGWKLPGFIVRLANGEVHHQLVWNNTVGWKFAPDVTKDVLPKPTTFAAFLEKYRPTLAP